MPTRQQLDAVCSDLPIYFADEEGHKGLANTLALVNAGIMSEDGAVLKKDKDIRGGEIVMGSDGTPTGYLKEQAGTYVRSFLDNDSLIPVDLAKDVIRKIQEQLLSEGYTMYVDGWSDYFFNDNYYQAARQMDDAGEMNFVLGMSCEVESWMDVDEALSEAVDVKKYASDHVKPNWVKFFMDGTVESGTGFVDGYLDGHEGTAIWTEEEFTDIARKVNEQGLTMHVHAMGDMAIRRAVNAFINGGKDEMRNTLVHLRNVDLPDYQRMADHNIYVTSGILWHFADTAEIEVLKDIVPADIRYESYPLKSFLDWGSKIGRPRVDKG